ncbi:suppressor APC domain-containing protein 2 isoform X1 [Schistocerca americana]|uniref:suppressor APC domain-containing protein 2 isoform X1 n=2 Tax=Schistocerca americana TaxID=7009 RepID=UPI001F4F75FB|nr:suppressor APC domain-containing protein 2 isoform X1 [Schistocerca americana]
MLWIICCVGLSVLLLVKFVNKVITSQMSQPQSATLDGLPKQFVIAMRTLFDIMDDKRTGYVKFSEIENRWQDDGTKGLPKGVIDSLQKVTPPNGLLSFERFCAGLKICLLRNQVESTRIQMNKQITSEVPISSQPVRPPSAPLLDNESSPKAHWPTTNTATVRPNVMPQQRTLSMPQLIVERKDTVQTDVSEFHNYNSDAKLTIPNVKPSTALYAPPKPPRTAAGLERAMLTTNTDRNGASERNLDKAEIRTALQNWQMGLMMNEHEFGKSSNDKKFGYPISEQRSTVRGGRSSGDGKPSGQPEQPNVPHKKTSVRRREPRRHTLQNGIDYNMLKRMKQIEQEKDVLMQGLQAVEKARDWYLKQVAVVQEKMKYLGRMGSHMEQWTEAQQERLELQRARVLEVNRHLATLTESWERGGLPLHMNLAVHHTSPPSHDILARLKQQNHLLTEEVSRKSERITILEREKASLMRELYQTRSQGRRGKDTQDDTAFM